MKVIVLQEFRDKDNFSKVYEENEVYDLDKNYAEHLARLGLVEIEDSPFFKSKNPFDEVELSLEELKSIAQEMGYTLEPIKPVDEIKAQGTVDNQEVTITGLESGKGETTQELVPESEDPKKEKKSGK